MDTRALWCAALLLALCTPAIAMETLHIGFGIKTETDGRAVETADDASLAEGRLLVELLPYTNPTFAIGEQLFLVLALETASGDLSPFTLNVREPTGARRPLTREAPLVLTGGETIPMLELWMHGNAAAGDYSVTVSVAQVRGTKGLTSRFGDFSSEERTTLIPGTCPHEPGGKVVSEEKQAVIAKISGRLCQLALNDDIHGVHKTLEGMGNYYLGEPITLLEAYPYIRCLGKIGWNLDLFRLTTQTPSPRYDRNIEYPSHMSLMDMGVLDLLAYFYRDNQPCGRVSFRKIMACKVDDGYGCMNFLSYLENIARLRGKSNQPMHEEAYDDFQQFLNKMINLVDGPMHDAHFCALGNEPAYAQCYGGG